VCFVADNKSVDFWALGIFIFEMLVGRTPFSENVEYSDDPVATVYSQINEVRMQTRELQGRELRGRGAKYYTATLLLMYPLHSTIQGKFEFPKTFKDGDAEELVRSLLMHSPVQRIGCLRRGAVDVKRHMWFDTMEWGALLEKHMEVRTRPAMY
jgi:serine/threonine protein kinase